jgi:hypothetical protein
MFATQLGLCLGLPLPRVESVDVSDWLIQHTPELRIQVDRAEFPCSDGLQLGSQYPFNPLCEQMEIHDDLPAASEFRGSTWRGHGYRFAALISRARYLAPYIRSYSSKVAPSTQGGSRGVSTMALYLVPHVTVSADAEDIPFSTKAWWWPAAPRARPSQRFWSGLFAWPRTHVHFTSCV